MTFFLRLPQICAAGAVMPACLPLYTRKKNRHDVRLTAAKSTK